MTLSAAVAQDKGDKSATRPRTNASSEGAVFEVGPGITPPQPIYTPDPDYLSQFVRKDKVQGVCMLGLIVDENGEVRDVHITPQWINCLDQNAIDAVKRWKLKPGMKDEEPVALRTSVEVDFRLY